MAVEVARNGDLDTIAAPLQLDRALVAAHGMTLPLQVFGDIGAAFQLADVVESLVGMAVLLDYPGAGLGGGEGAGRIDIIEGLFGQHRDAGGRHHPAGMGAVVSSRSPPALPPITW